jgi:aspartyl-tRNA(Asn)/glutamyl-tRNA(Gln) amidotransferase subunit B
MTVMIGLETHVQLNTRSKMFCGCANPVNLDEEPQPNTLTCPTCLGMPGSKPRTNRAAIDAGIRLALALECRVEPRFFFSRKTYFYPDMSKNFQITQYEVPLCRDGRMSIMAGGRMKRIRITRIHLEEDPAKLVHVGGLGGKHTLVDYNRSGIPLAEIVTEPDFSSPAEAREFLQKLAAVLEYLGLYDPASRAVFKSDANVSLSGGERIEIKNITGTKEIEQALKYEIARQRNMLSRGVKVRRETRAWNPDVGSTQPLRGKEEEAEYGYIFEPDLARIEVGRQELAKARKALPELPDAKRDRYVRRFGMSGKVAESLVSDPQVAAFFEEVSGKVGKAGSDVAAAWIAGPPGSPSSYGCSNPAA